jgi:hypothetical protein
VAPASAPPLLSWSRSGFSVHNRVFAHPGNDREFEALVRYMMRSPISLSRLRFIPGTKEVVYTHKGGPVAAEPARDEQPRSVRLCSAPHGHREDCRTHRMSLYLRACCGGTRVSPSPVVKSTAG